MAMVSLPIGENQNDYQTEITEIIEHRGHVITVINLARVDFFFLDLLLDQFFLGIVFDNDRILIIFFGNDQFLISFFGIFFDF